jgi:hypothetical protein
VTPVSVADEGGKLDENARFYTWYIFYLEEETHLGE